MTLPNIGRANGNRADRFMEREKSQGVAQLLHQRTIASNQLIASQCDFIHRVETPDTEPNTAGSLGIVQTERRQYMARLRFGCAAS